jgi:hypothetical protein
MLSQLWLSQTVPHQFLGTLGPSESAGMGACGVPKTTSAQHFSGRMLMLILELVAD